MPSCRIFQQAQILQNFKTWFSATVTSSISIKKLRPSLRLLQQQLWIQFKESPHSKCNRNSKGFWIWITQREGTKSARSESFSTTEGSLRINKLLWPINKLLWRVNKLSGGICINLTQARARFDKGFWNQETFLLFLCGSRGDLCWEKAENPIQFWQWGELWAIYDSKQGPHRSNSIQWSYK